MGIPTAGPISLAQVVEDCELPVGTGLKDSRVRDRALKATPVILKEHFRGRYCGHMRTIDSQWNNTDFNKSMTFKGVRGNPAEAEVSNYGTGWNFKIGGKRVGPDDSFVEAYLCAKGDPGAFMKFYVRVQGWETGSVWPPRPPDTGDRKVHAPASMQIHSWADGYFKGESTLKYTSNFSSSNYNNAGGTYVCSEEQPYYTITLRQNFWGENNPDYKPVPMNEFYYGVFSYVQIYDDNYGLSMISPEGE